MFSDDQKRASSIKKRLQEKITNRKLENAKTEEEKKEIIESKKTYNLFEDKKIQEMANQLSPKTKKKFKKMGENYFKNLDIKQTKDEVSLGLTKDTTDKVTAALSYLLHGLKSGLHPKSLSKQEHQFLNDNYNTEWFKEFGFEEKDLK